MPPATPESIVEMIVEEVFRALNEGKAAGAKCPCAPGGRLSAEAGLAAAGAGLSAPASAAEGLFPAGADSGAEPFLLAPEAFPDPIAPDQRTLAKGYVPIGVSARHCHVSQEDLQTLFGADAKLTEFKPLRQVGEFAAEQTVTIVGPRMRALEGVRILGPCRGGTQVEISLTDAIYLGLRPPVRPSGDHSDTPGILMIGPKGFIHLKKGVIRANRHVHLSDTDARALGVKDNEKVMIRIAGDRPVIYHDVQVRVKSSFMAEMHLDTDDANAVGVTSGDIAQILRGYHECRICEDYRGRP